jgi:hypothetical protein
VSGLIGSGPVGSLSLVDSIDNVSGLQTALDAKTTESYVDTQITAVVGAAQPISYITNLQTELDELEVLALAGL